MTLDEKVGQMTQAERARAARARPTSASYFLGSVLSGGGSAPPDKTAPGWAEMYDRYQSIALADAAPHPAPLRRRRGPRPQQRRRGRHLPPQHRPRLHAQRRRSSSASRRATAEEVAATGIDWTFSPCIAVARDERWGRTYESFGETPELVSEMARGRGARLPADGILACAKHYLADGGTAGGRDQGDAQIDEATLRAIHLPGYRAAVAAGVGSVMASFSSWNGQKMHGNRYLLTDVLKGELGFSGFVVSDWAGIDQLPGDYASDVETSINAGIDMVMVPGALPRVRRHAEVARAVRAACPQSRIDDAVRRILRQKVALGLWDSAATPTARSSPQVGSDAHRQVGARGGAPVARAAEERRPRAAALEDDAAHPRRRPERRRPRQPVRRLDDHLAGRERRDHDRARRSCRRIRAAVLGGASASPTPRRLGRGGRRRRRRRDRRDALRRGRRRPQRPVAVAPTTSRRCSAVQAARACPTVVVLVSGRPLILDAILGDADAIVAAWLPGTEGAGVADVLFGDYAPTGKLSHSWPRTHVPDPDQLGRRRRTTRCSPTASV